MFAQRSPIIILQNIISAIFGYVGLFFILRYIGTTDWGFVGFGIGFVGILSVVGDLGYSTAHTIKISQGDDIASCNGTFFTIKLVLGFAFVALVVLSLQIWTTVLHRGFENPIEYWIVLSLIPYFFFQNFMGFTQTYFRATLKSVRSSIPPLVEAILRNSIFIVLALTIYYSSAKSPDYSAALYVSFTYSVTYTVYFVVSLLLGRPWKMSRPTKALFKSYTALALPLILVASVGTISGNIDKVFIQIFFQAVTTGAFYTSQQIALMITTISGSMSMFFIPLLIRYRKDEGKEAHNRSIFEFERLISLYLLPFTVALVVLAPFVMNIFTASYIPFAGMLAVLSVRAYVGAINTPYTSSIVSRSRTRTIAKIDTVLVTMNIVLIVLFVPPNIFGFTGFSMGPIGAPIAMLIVTLVGAIAYRVIVSRIESIKYNYGVLKHLAPAAVQALFILMVEYFITPKDILILAPVILASIGIYLIAAIAMKETSFEMLLEIVRNFSPKALAHRYVVENGEADPDNSTKVEPKKDY